MLIYKENFSFTFNKYVSRKGFPYNLKVSDIFSLFNDCFFFDFFFGSYFFTCYFFRLFPNISNR